MDNLSNFLTPNIASDPSIALAGSQAQQFNASAQQRGGSVNQQAYGIEYQVPFAIRYDTPIVITDRPNSAGISSPVGTGTGAGEGSNINFNLGGIPASPPPPPATGGVSGQVQFNFNGALAGDVNLVYDPSVAELGVAVIVDIGGAGMNIQPQGNLLLKSFTDNIEIQTPAATKSISIQANRDINLTTTNRDINVISKNDITIQSQTGQLTLQAQAGSVVIQATASGQEVVIQADQDIVLSAGSPIAVVTSTGIILFNTSAPATFPGGGTFYASAGALHWIGSGGTDTTIAPA